MQEDKYYENQKFENLKIEGEIFVNDIFSDCEFIDCTFEECALQSCSFLNCKFYKTSIISLNAKQSQMKYSSFTNCNLIGVHWNDLLPTGKVAEPIYKMENCLLKYNTFINMSFQRFNFAENVIIDSVFDECNLRESSFKGCKLDATQFTRSDIRKADFRESMGYQIDVISNQIKDAKFSFPEVVNLLVGLGIKID